MTTYNSVSVRARETGGAWLVEEIDLPYDQIQVWEAGYVGEQDIFRSDVVKQVVDA